MLNFDRDVWVTTNSNKSFYLNKMNPENINIWDIHQGLSNICRFAGQITPDYKVAQHCCIVSDYLPDEFKFEGLMHDAAEWVTGDIPKPIKWMIPEVAELELFIYNQIAEVFKLPRIISLEVKKVDDRLLQREALLMFDFVPDWVRDSNIKPLDIEIEEVWSAEKCRTEFMKRFMELAPK